MVKTEERAVLSLKSGIIEECLEFKTNVIAMDRMRVIIKGTLISIPDQNVIIEKVGPSNNNLNYYKF
ncbi:MAG: hypothetical protein AB9922_07530 [Bacteroidales bacterium]